MQLSDYLAISSIIVAIVVGAISWFVSAYLAKKSVKKQKLSYEIKMQRIISKSFLEKTNELTMYFKDEILPEPTLLSVNIVNVGNVAIEKPPIVIKAVGATYVLPGYIDDIPQGYEELWSLERTDAEECSINLEHINPGQVVKARFFLDEYPKETPIFMCPMKDLEIKKVNAEINELILEQMINIGTPNVIKSMTAIIKIFSRF